MVVSPYWDEVVFWIKSRTNLVLVKTVLSIRDKINSNSHKSTKLSPIEISGYPKGKTRLELTFPGPRKSF